MKGKQARWFKKSWSVKVLPATVGADASASNASALPLFDPGKAVGAIANRSPAAGAPVRLSAKPPYAIGWPGVRVPVDTTAPPASSNSQPPAASVNCRVRLWAGPAGGDEIASDPTAALPVLVFAAAAVSGDAAAIPRGSVSATRSE